MATIRTRKTKKGKVRHYVEIRLKGVPPIRKTLSGTRKQAERWAEDVEAGIRLGAILPSIEAEKHTVAETIDRYLEDHLDELTSEKGQKDRRHHLEWWKRELGPLTLAKLKPAVIYESRRKLLGRVSGPTSNRYLAALSAVMRRAAGEWQWMEANPVSRVQRKREHAARVRFLDDDERKRLLEACRESSPRRLYPLVLFALATGARRGELLGLRWKDVDLKADPPRAVLHETKNRDRRTLSFPGKAAEALRELAKTPHISGYLFAAGRGRPSFPRKKWQKALSAARIDDFRFHDLRHTAASYLAMSGATLPELAAFLGHRTLEMVKRYSHLTEQHSEQVASRMVEKYLA